MKIIQIADLHCTLAGADKAYHCVIQETEGGYTVDFAYGRRNSTLTRGTKTASPVPLEKAEKIFSKLVTEKTSKGYVSSPGISGIVFAGQQTEGCSSVVAEASACASDKVSTGIFPQLLNSIDSNEAERLIEDPEWGAQEKCNGRRHMVKRDESAQIIGINRKSFIVPTSPAVASSVEGIGTQLLLDGETIGDTLHCFGLLEHDGRDLRGLPYFEVHGILSTVLEGHTGRGLELVPLAVTTEEKRSLYHRLQAEKAEGIVFKRLGAPYTPDRPASLGNHLKRKFTETASVIVLGVNEGKRSIRMGLYSEGGKGEPVFVGSCTIPPNQFIPQEGLIAEIEYLYAYRLGCLFQPVYLGLRDDIDLADCTTKQLKYVEEAAAA
ncbi:MAG: ATP-dependent DNA ligase [Thermodesulfovibrio sp.]|nr:ATP-dependent DNA ligase [Thermodesulfovibrio sp.]